MQPPEFVEFSKIARLNRDCVITEKIDGTNAQLYIPVDESEPIVAGSRNRWLIGCDNAGFAAWVRENEAMLRRLGPGRHYGEWWGAGIQRRYGLTEKRLSLFNVHRWEKGIPEGVPVSLVPVLYKGPFATWVVDDVVRGLREGGSFAAPGFMDPEGVVVFHTASSTLYKVTVKDDEKPKGAK